MALPSLCLTGGCIEETPPPQPNNAVKVTVTSNVILSSPPRLGVNLGKNYYSGDQQFAANPFAHGGFSKGRQVHGFRVTAATANTVTDANAVPGDPDTVLAESFAGGTYFVATGTRAGESGSITAHDPETGRFTLSKSGEPIAENQFIWMEGPLASRALPDPKEGEQPLGIGDFRLEAETGVTHEFVEDPANGDLAQVLQFNFPGTGARMFGAIKHYIRATPNTRYRITFRAKSDRPSAEISVRLTNLGMPPESNGAVIDFESEQEKALTNDWRQYAFEGETFADSSIGDSFSAVSISSVLNADATEVSHVWLDDFVLEDLTNGHPTGFPAHIVETLKEGKVGTLRFYGTADLGAKVRNFTGASTTDAGWNYLSLQSFFRFNTVDTVADQWMLLSKEVGAQPWITVGSVNTPEDWYQLISYLAAPAGFDEDSGRRASHGHATPWTQEFDKIYLEIGNEWWNPIFTPFHLWEPATYAALCETIVDRVKQHPHYDAERIVIIAGGWAINGHHWNEILDEENPGNQRISIAPYLVHELNQATSPNEKFQTFFADVESYAQGPGSTIFNALEASAPDTGLAVYELNTHPTGGAASPETVSEIAPSTAAGIAVLDQALSLMSRFEATPVNYFTLLQREYNGRLGLWGTTIREVSGKLRPRPVWHGLRLANQYLIQGDLVACAVADTPTWDQAENGTVAEVEDVPMLHAYAFLDEAGSQPKANVLLINRSLERSLPVTITLPFQASGDVQSATLTSNLPQDNNEDQERVTLSEKQLTGYQPGDELIVPPCAAVVYQFQGR